MTERPVTFDCCGQRLCGILHVPDVPHSHGIVMLVGGPQYRVGSHRQFVLTARALASDGVSVLRFDHRGIGDSEGDERSFEDIWEDIDSAVEALLREVPAVSEAVVWGLCDAASAVALFAHCNARITGVVLLNPWVRDEKTIARTYLRHYYPNRLFSPSLWGKVFGGNFEFRRAWRSFAETTLAAIKRSGSSERTLGGHSNPSLKLEPLQARMADGLQRFTGRILVILSGQDLTAREFTDVSREVSAWRKLLEDPRVTRRDLPEADHTFRVRSHLDQAALWTSEWIREQ